jgi:hypothetical protein
LDNRQTNYEKPDSVCLQNNPVARKTGNEPPHGKREPKVRCGIFRKPYNSGAIKLLITLLLQRMVRHPPPHPEISSSPIKGPAFTATPIKRNNKAGWREKSPGGYLTEALHHPTLKDNAKTSSCKASVPPWGNFPPSRLFLLPFNIWR